MLGTILAILGLGFLIFIHELGHYWMARRVGMRVEVFSIGFGSPLISWTRNNGERWQIGWLPFGGYVKISGTEREGDQDPYKVADGFFGKGPWSRIKVAFMGPFVNLLFAFIVFAFLFLAGGREQFFAALTPSVGSVDPASELYSAGFRPGDEILQYGTEPVRSFKDHLFAPIMANGETDVKVRLHDWTKGTSEEKSLSLAPYKKQNSAGDEIATFGFLAPASFVTFNPSWTTQTALPKAPLAESGIEPGDTIVWLDGMPIFSQPQLTALVQESKALVVVNRNGNLLVRRVPRVPLASLKLDSFAREEIRDWTYEAAIQATKQPLFFIPYNLASDGTVDGRFRFIDKEDEIKYIPEHLKTDVERNLEIGDRIVSVDGKKVTSAPDILKALQTHAIHLIVYRDKEATTPLLPSETQALYGKIHDERGFAPLIAALADPKLPKQTGSFILLNGVTPKPLKEFSETDKDATDGRLYLGLTASDHLVRYNPNPFEQFYDVVSEIGTTLGGLIFGHIDPKQVSGPVGIVHLISGSWSAGIKNGLFWLAVISLNLACINLLPLPILDGGTIALSAVEMATGKPISLKLLDKLVFPFALALIALFLFFTYHDVLRLFGSLLK